MTAAHRHSLVHVDAAKRISFKRPPGVAWRDYLIMLLHLAAEVEHGLMVQYLYAAFSLGGPDVTPKRAEKVARWQRSILGGQRYPFANMINALREIRRGTHRPYPCGAGAGYLGVSAEGDLFARHRSVGDDGGCHHEVIRRGRPACDFIRGWLQYCIAAVARGAA